MTTQSNPVALRQKAVEVRKTVLTMIYQAASGHPGGSLSAADIMTALYFSHLNIDPKNPRWENRDRFILSKGHVCPVLYACLALRGYFDTSELSTLRKEGSILQGHPDMKRCPGVDISSGSLGQGLSIAAGMALGAKRDGRSYRVFCLLGDGETAEGQIWEAVSAASKYGLDNLVIIVDNNGLQNDGFCDEIMPTRDLAAKFRAFGCETSELDGHNMDEILTALQRTQDTNENNPKCLIAKTVKGKGVSFMENVAKWHGLAPNEDEYRQAIAELEEFSRGLN